MLSGVKGATGVDEDLPAGPIRPLNTMAVPESDAWPGVSLVRS
jgi:hypothetical protein